MKLHWDSPVTTANFRDAWQAVDLYRRTARKKAVLAGIPALIAHGALLLVTLFIGNGLILRFSSGVYSDWLRSVPLFVSAWGWFDRLLSGVTLHPALQCLLAVPLVLSAALVIYLLGALGVAIACHPASVPCTATSARDQGALLLKRARQARRYAAATRWFFCGPCPVIFAVSCLALTAACILSAEDMGAAVEDLGQFPLLSAFLPPIAVIVTVLALLSLGYAGLDALLGLVLKLIYRCPLEQRLIADAEAFSLFSAREDGKLPPQEILASRKAYGESRRTEALTKERQGINKGVRAMLLEAALAGDVLAMAHYARHCLICRERENALYWLERCRESGIRNRRIERTIRKLRRGSLVKATYLKN